MDGQTQSANNLQMNYINKQNVNLMQQTWNAYILKIDTDIKWDTKKMMT